LKGTIQKYFSNRGFGFIEIDGSEDNIFFHRSNYPVNDIPSIGQDVEFILVETPKGNEAKEIKLVAAVSDAPEEEPEEAAAPADEAEEVPESVDDLDQMQGVGPKYQELLRAAKVKSIKDIAGYAPEALLEKLLAVNQEENITKRPPTLAKVEDWVEKAKNPE
jgi:CspA family cold shock protein